VQVKGADRDPAALQRLRTLGGEASTLEDIMASCDIVIATTGVKGLIKPEWVRPGQMILALSNPDAEIDPLKRPGARRGLRR
jgi:malate dehydrogenase (oxaloacetate-decarboxylating)